MIPRIKMVQIKNYKSLAAVSVQLEPFTVFVGPNGSGKSNFIDALAFVQECVSESVELAVQRRGGLGVILSRLEYPFPVQFPPAHLSKAEQDERFERSVEAASTLGFELILDLAEGFTADYSLALALLPGGGFFISRERCALKRGESVSDLFEVKNGKFVHEIPGITPILLPDRLALFAASATETFRPVYEFLASMRFYSILPHNMREPQDPDLGIYLKRDGSNAAAVLRNLNRYGPAVKDFNETLKRLLATVTEGIVAVEDAPAGTKETLRFLQDIGLQQPAVFYALNMSDGTLRALGILLAIYQFGMSRVIGIEEPEATIHPTMIQMIMEVLLGAANEKQIMITTHSPEVLDQKELKDEQIRMVALRNGQSVIAPLSDTTRDAIRERLATPGELLRMGEVRPEDEAMNIPPKAIDLFGPPFHETA